MPTSNRPGPDLDKAPPDDHHPIRSGSRRPGRPAGESRTRGEILAAARKRFSSNGYAGTTIRAIATTAEVDPALVIHFYDSKDALFAASLAFPEHVADTVPEILAGPAESVGERLTRFYFELWEGPETGDQLRAMCRSIASNEHAATMAHEFISSQLIARAAEAYNYNHVDLRVTLAGGQLVGVMYARHIVGVEPLASLPIEDLVKLVAPSVQRYLTSDLLDMDM